MVSMAWTIYLGRHSEDDIRCFRDYLSLPKVSESESTSESVTNRIADRLNIEMEKPVSDEALLKTHVNYARAMMVNEAIQQCASLLPA